MDDNDKTTVIFRKFRKGGEIIALFPYEPGDTVSPYVCQSYMHERQHGPAAIAVLMSGATVPAKPEEYAALQKELEAPPYKYHLIIRKRTPKDDVDVRRRKLTSTENQEA